MEFSEKAIVLKTGRFKETDLWVRLFSASAGVHTAFAFGGSVSRKRFTGCLDPVSLVLFKVARGGRGDFLHLKEGALINAYPALKRDGGLLGCAVNCLKFVEAAQGGPEGGQAAFNLLAATLDCLEAGPETPEVLPVFFRARMAFEQGYAPRLDTCCRCGRSVEDMAEPGFLPEQGKVGCAACFAGTGSWLPLPAPAMELMLRIASKEPACWAVSGLDPQAVRACCRALDGYVGRHMGLIWRDGTFRQMSA